MAEPPSGAQYDISAGEQQATIVEVSGGIRNYTVGGWAVLEGYDVTEQCTGARGDPLTPWPNRLADGKYTFDGIDHQLSISEPDKHNAIHGLLRWRNWDVRDHSSDRVVMGTVLHPLTGYPFTLDVSVEYRLDHAGLSVRSTATNLGDRTCPYGFGQHPYLTVGADMVDVCVLEFEAATWLPTDQRGLPTGVEPVDGSPYDFRGGRLIGDQDIDFTFTDLGRDQDGLSWVRLTGPDGRSVSLWLDERHPFLEIYTAHTQPRPHWRRGLGVEPMTCAPNAFRSGHGLVRLEPGQTTESRWGIRPPDLL
jgi:aldose 1-epimerase